MPLVPIIALVFFCCWNFASGSLQMYLDTMYSDASCTNVSLPLYWTPTTGNCTITGTGTAKEIIYVSGTSVDILTWSGTCTGNPSGLLLTLGQCSSNQIVQQLTVDGVIERTVYSTTGCHSANVKQQDYWPIGYCTASQYPNNPSVQAIFLTGLASNTFNFTAFADLACTIPAGYTFILTSGACLNDPVLGMVMFSYSGPGGLASASSSTGGGGGGNGGNDSSSGTTAMNESTGIFLSSSTGTGCRQNTTCASTLRSTYSLVPTVVLVTITLFLVILA